MSIIHSILGLLKINTMPVAILASETYSHQEIEWILISFHILARNSVAVTRTLEVKSTALRGQQNSYQITATSVMSGIPTLHT